ncbi:agmatinase [Mailhella massiliensis]|uniref:Agmatinase n=1 Tax=Mailhella massiliensis TaxID=1903261 RepID=A0A921DQR1_9BACT|nr:agmatinase [Mailhella massiliensis]HJD96769.1 agmatinase [Mailhella massiliensis]
MLKEYENRFLSSEVPARPANEARFHVIPVPYEATVSYAGGTERGPEAILEASDQLELYDGTSFPGEEGIFTHCPVDCSGAPEHVMNRVRLAVLAALDMGAVPVVLGGEHSLTYGEMVALKERFGSFGVVQFDAHADLRDSYEGSRWSHASVMRRAVADLELPLVQLGNRIFCREELEARKKHGVVAWDAPQLCRDGLPEKLLPDDFPENIFITFDVDGLDPSIMPETGTPVPGGLSWYQALDLAAKAVEGRNLLGFDIVELAPREGHIVSDFTAASLTYALMGIAQRSGKR